MRSRPRRRIKAPERERGKNVFSLEICIDVPDIGKGERFYAAAFGFTKVAEPYPGVAILKIGDCTITLLEKREQTQPSPNTPDVRRYSRHWTPVHLDFHVDDLKRALKSAIDAGATQEQLLESDAHGSIAFCADPFGNGFCLLQGSANT
jgi:predicted enzyme related to lactoylglutathione lyase